MKRYPTDNEIVICPDCGEVEYIEQEQMTVNALMLKFKSGGWTSDQSIGDVKKVGHFRCVCGVEVEYSEGVDKP